MSLQSARQLIWSVRTLMPFTSKVVLHSKSGYRPELDALVRQFIEAGVKFVGVVGVDSSRIEDIIDGLCVGNGSNPYFMLTSSHEGETVAEAVTFAETLTEEYAGAVQVVEF